MTDALKIVLGVAATLLATVAGFYVTSSLSLAQKQLVAATRLGGYLTYWQNWILEHELFSVYGQGVKWNEEIREIVKRRGTPQEALKLQEETKKRMSQVKEGIEKGEIEFDREKMFRDLLRLPKEFAVGMLVESSKTIGQNLIEGKTFISDEEAAILGVAFTNVCIELKMGIIDLVGGGIGLVISLVNAPEDFDIKNFSTEISQIVWKGILVSKNIDSLARSARAIASKSVVALTLQNIRNGSRLTKR